MYTMDQYLKDLSKRMDEKRRNAEAPIDNVVMFRVLGNAIEQLVNNHKLDLQHRGVALRVSTKNDAQVVVRATADTSSVDVEIHRKQHPVLGSIIRMNDPGDTARRRQTSPETFNDDRHGMELFVLQLQQAIDHVLGLSSQ